MTDEEMADKHAEEYVMREDVITENDRVPFDNGYGFQTVDFEKEVKKGYKDGFLAGLKVGRPQWHNINDKEPSKEQLGKHLLIRMESVIGNTDYDYLVYKYAGESITDVAGVIAWCEIPTFDKE